jgi:hypothetical protein
MSDPEHNRNTDKAFCDALNLFVGRGKRFSIAGMASATGIAENTLGCYLRGTSTPAFYNQVRLQTALPPEFANELLRLSNLAGARRIDGETTPPETLREITEGAAALAAAWADGHIDHTEKPKVRKELTEAMCAISQLLSQLDRDEINQ